MMRLFLLIFLSTSIIHGMQIRQINAPKIDRMPIGSNDRILIQPDRICDIAPYMMPCVVCAKLREDSDVYEVLQDRNEIINFRTRADVHALYFVLIPFPYRYEILHGLPTYHGTGSGSTIVVDR